MNHLPMIVNHWEDYDVEGFRRISEKLIRSYNKKFYSPIGELAMSLIESAYEGATNGKLTHVDFNNATFYASYISEIPRDVLCIYLTKILLSRGDARRNIASGGEDLERE